MDEKKSWNKKKKIEINMWMVEAKILKKESWNKRREKKKKEKPKEGRKNERIMGKSEEK